MRALLSDAIDDFLAFRRSQDYSKGTIRQNESSLRRFLAAAGNVYCDAITDRQVTRFFEVAARTKQPQSLRNDHHVLSQFFAWGRQTKRVSVDSDPLFGRRRARPAARERNRLHVSKFPALLDAADDARNRAMLALLLYTLTREQEMLNLRIRDVDLDAGYLTVAVFKTHGSDRIPICEELDEELRAWLTVYAQSCGPLQPGWYLIPQRKPISVSERDASGRIAAMNFRYRPDVKTAVAGRIVRDALDKLGFPVVSGDGKPLYEGAHTIRRSGARALFDALVESGYDYSLRLVQSMLHHKSMQQTEAYIGITADRRTRDELIRGQVLYPSLRLVARLADHGNRNDQASGL